jgi:hypothetical protein
MYAQKKKFSTVWCLCFVFVLWQVLHPKSYFNFVWINRTQINVWMKRKQNHWGRQKNSGPYNPCSCATDIHMSGQL